jgi:NhaP-type Na+/H+ or K+/H+ antiporter
VLGLINPASWSIDKNNLLLEAARLTLVVVDMAAALRLPPGYMVRRWRSMAVMLGLLMPVMWIASGLAVWFVLGLPFWVAMLVGAVVTSTDPVAASSIVTGGIAKRNIAGRVRHLISGESASNDGTAYPIVLLPILILTYPVDQAIS